MFVKKGVVTCLSDRKKICIYYLCLCSITATGVVLSHVYCVQYNYMNPILSTYFSACDLLRAGLLIFVL